MPSSNDSTNNSPFGVQYGYPQGTRITDSSKVADILQSDVAMPASEAQLFSSSRASQFSAIGLPRVYPTQGQIKSGDFVGAMAQDPISIGTARHMANPQVANRYFEQRVNQDTKALETAYRAFSDPQQAFSKIGYEGTVSSMEEARAQISAHHRHETEGLHDLASRIVKEAGVEPHQTRELTKAQHMAGRIIAGQVERNVGRPMSFQQAHTLASEKLGGEAGQTISAIGGKRLDDYSETEKSAFRSATRQVKGGEPKVEQSFNDLTTVVKELSVALKELTKSAKPQESKGELIQQRHDLAMERQLQKQGVTEARDVFRAGVSKDQIQQKHDLSMIQTQKKHDLAMERQLQAQEFRREMAGGVPKSKLQEFGLGAMHRGDVLRVSNLMGRGARRGLQGAFGMGMGMAGGSSISQSIGSINPLGIPVGALTAMPMQMLRNIGMQGAEMELVSLQAEFLREGQAQTGRMIAQNGSQSNTVAGIFELSRTLGISPSQSATMLKDVGFADPSQSLGVQDIAQLTFRGFNPAQVGQLGGQLGMLNAGLGSRDVMGLLNRSGMRGGQAMEFASRIADFTRGRRVAGLGLGRNFLGRTANRVQSMGVGVEAGLATLGKVQRVGVEAGQGLTSMFGGMADLAIQASAFEQAGGDLFEAQRIAEQISGSPERLMDALRSQGMSERQINLTLAGRGFTTGQVEQVRKAKGGGGRLDPSMAGDVGARLDVSRRLAQRQEADVKQLYSTTGKDGESLITKLDAMLTADTKYQEQVLKTMVTAQQISNIGEMVTDLTTVVAKTNVLISGVADFLNDVQQNGLKTTIKEMIF